MAKAKKLPSGNWRVRVYSHTTPDGKKHYESFTASTKQQAEMMATKFANSADRNRGEDITVKEAVDNYINANEGTLSPSTIYGYRKDAKRFDTISNIRVRKINSTIIQSFISDLSVRNLSPKTVRNTYALLRASLAFSGADVNYRIHLPQNQKKRKNAPEDEQIIALYNAAKPKMKIAIMLASRHSLRRGEVCGLTYGDLSGNTLYVHSDVVKSSDGKSWVHKETPKTSSSNRLLYLTEQELKLIGNGSPNEYIVPLVPSSIGTNFYNLRKKVGIDGIRFHDLRVYFASVSAALNIPELYTAHHGGWKENSRVLKEHYQKPIASIDEAYAKKLNDHFENMTRNMTQEM